LSELGRSEEIATEDLVGKIPNPPSELFDAEESLSVRPSWQQSEDDVGRELGPNVRSQVSFKDGVEVPWGTPGSVRPDFIVDDIGAFEVKNYDITTNAAALIGNVTNQAIERASHLPDQLIQNVIIDIRGQGATTEQRSEIVEKIVKKSGNIIDPLSVSFKD
jgi:filamentous hemagglutinin